MRRTQRPARFAVALLAMLLAAPAVAQEEQRSAEQVLSQAATEFADGRFEAARSLLLQAQELTQDARLLGQIHLQLGLNHAAQNRNAEARRAFSSALTHDPSLDLDQQQYSSSFVTLFRAARGRTLGKLRISADRADVEVAVGARACGPPPVELWLPPGEHSVTVRDRGGHLLNTSSVKVSAGQTSQLAVATITAAPPKPRARPDRRPREPAPPPRRRRIWTWVAGAAAVAAAAVAVGVGISANADADEACALLAGTGPCDARERLLDDSARPRYEALYARVDRKAIATNVAWGTAAVLAMGAVLLYWIEGRAGAPPSRARLRLLRDRGSAALQLQLRY